MQTLTTITTPNNHTVVSLAAVAYCNLYWRDRSDTFHRRIKPDSETVNGQVIDSNALAASHPLYPGETLGTRARRLGLLDSWTPVCVVQLTRGHRLTYEGAKALAVWKTWLAKQYGKSKHYE